jgi:imidazolonepropionase-like amidohydrolase
MKRTISLLIISLFLNAAYSFDDIAIKGGTVIDIADWGKSAKDIKNAVVLIKGSRIVEVGEINTITIPEGEILFDYFSLDSHY